jgi:DNA-binding XRE family transcriptional regulator
MAETTPANMALDELRATLDLTQEHLAVILRISRATAPTMERRAGMYVSTLGRCIEVIDGDLEIRAVLPDGFVRISQFGGSAKPSA